VIRRFRGMGIADSRSLRYDNYVRMLHFVRPVTSVPFWRFGGDVRRECKQRLSAALHGTLGSYPRDALHEGSADVVACLHVRAAQPPSSCACMIIFDNFDGHLFGGLF
jgi:hypothetical protein